MYYLGIDLGGTNIAAGIVDKNFSMVAKGSVPTGREREYTDIIRDMADFSKRLITDAGLTTSDIEYIGIGSPGVCDRENGILLYANNIKFNNVPMAKEMQKYISLPVYLDNDANCAALGESMAGAAKDVSDSVTVTLGTGIGGGIVINRRIFSGFNGMAGEIGHTLLIADGELCTCGKKGCWEAYASATALIRQTRAAAEENPGSEINRLVDGNLDLINAKTAFDAMRLGDDTGTRVVEQYIRYLAEGIANIIVMLQPEKVVIGGGISKEGETLLKPLRKAVKERLYYRKDDVPQAELVAAELGNDAGIIGAAMLGMQGGF
ncbi:MAG: ROK family glucokinase [Clostridiaceae bacterium]|nr:ROK family glucokinase [Clostridiaceae bacterium]